MAVDTGRGADTWRERVTARGRTARRLAHRPELAAVRPDLAAVALGCD